MAQPFTYKGNLYQFDPPKTDSVSIAVKCEVCGEDIEADESCWRSWERYIHEKCRQGLTRV